MAKKKKKKETKGKEKEENSEIEEPKIKRVPFDSRASTYEHIQAVQVHMFEIMRRIGKRALEHDESKLEDPEKEYWDKYTPLLADIEYGSDEYEASLDALKPALDHHYAKNSHHPQHYPDGINDMTLMDIIEMFCDWKASTERQHDGNIRKSLEFNKKRFNMSPQLFKILLNTVKQLGW